MLLFETGETILELRKSLGMSQEELSRGLCSVEMLSKIEKGETRPSWTVLKTLMERLDEDPLIHYTEAVSTPSWYASNLNDRIKILLEKENEEANLVAERLINEGESEGFPLVPQFFFDKQFLQRNKALLYFNRKEYEAAYKCAFEAIKIFYDDFREENISQFCFSYLELDLLNIMAMSQFYFISPEKSTETYLKILDSFKNYLKNKEQTRNQHIKILYNLSENYGKLKEYEKCISVCDEGIGLCKVAYDLRFYPLLLFNKGYCLLYLNEIEQAKPILAKALAMFYASNNDNEISMMESFLKDEFYITLSELKNIINNQI